MWTRSHRRKQGLVWWLQKRSRSAGGTSITCSCCISPRVNSRNGSAHRHCSARAIAKRSSTRGLYLMPRMRGERASRSCSAYCAQERGCRSPCRGLRWMQAVARSPVHRTWTRSSTSPWRRSRCAKPLQSRETTSSACRCSWNTACWCSCQRSKCSRRAFRFSREGTKMRRLHTPRTSPRSSERVRTRSRLTTATSKMKHASPHSPIASARRIPGRRPSSKSWRSVDGHGSRIDCCVWKTVETSTTAWSRLRAARSCTMRSTDSSRRCVLRMAARPC